MLFLILDKFEFTPLAGTINQFVKLLMINRINQNSSVRPPSGPPDFWEWEAINIASHFLLHYKKVYSVD